MLNFEPRFILDNVLNGVKTVERLERLALSAALVAAREIHSKVKDLTLRDRLRRCEIFLLETKLF